MNKTRYNLLFSYLALSVVVCAGLRIWLTVSAIGQNAEFEVSEVLGAFAVGVLYDLTFALYAGLIIAIVFMVLPERFFMRAWPRRFALLVYFGLLISLVFTVLAEIVFWEEFSTRFNFIAVDYLVYRHEVTNNIYESYPVVTLLLGVTLIALMFFFVTRRFVSKSLKTDMPFKARAQYGSIWAALAVVAVLLVGQTPRNQFENNFAKEIASNGSYQFFAAFRNNELDYDTLYAKQNDDEIASVMRNRVARPNSRFINDNPMDVTRFIDNPGKQKKLNVVLISEESLGAASINRYGEKLPLTPFIDEWMQESMVFDRTYATGTRTTRGLEAITLSIPPTPGRSIVKRPDNGNMYSLGRVFAEHDYDVAYLYGGRGFFDNMNEFFSGNGYRIVDQTMFENDEIEFSNAWGVDDASLFRETVQQADANFAKDKNFFFHVMTVSNHQPFTYPDGKIDIPSGIGRNGGIMYADYALREFIKEAKTKPWFDDTVFVMIADHTANSSGKIGLPVEKYHIPFLIYSPKHITPKAIDKVISQIDLAPTVLGLLNMDYVSGFFGEDVLAPGYKERALIGNYQKLGLYEGDEVIVLSPHQQVERIVNPLSDERIEKINQTDTDRAKKAIAYYQTANNAYKKRLNRLGPKHAPIGAIGGSL